MRAIGHWQFAGPAWRRRIARAAAQQLAGRPATIRRGAAGGLRFDPGGMNPGYVLGTTEALMQATVAKHLKSGEVFLDVGAAAGLYTLLAARIVGSEGCVYAFEPLPASADLVECNARSNAFPQVHVLRKAVSSTSGAGFLLIDAEANHSRLLTTPADNAIAVEVVTIDELVDAQAIRPPNFVKVDVEGAELDVLHGMRRTIKRHRPSLLIELHWVGPSFVKLANELLGGYDLSPLSDDPAFRLDAIAYGHVLATAKSRQPRESACRAAT
ncbi:MAG: FkbM family methyltransferase [Gaiellaceae bacterium]